MDSKKEMRADLSCIAMLSNFNCNSTVKAKDLVNFPSSLQFFTFTPDIPVVRTKTNEDLT